MYKSRMSRVVILMASFTAALLLLFGLNQVTTAAPLDSDLSSSMKMVDKEEAAVGETLIYTIMITNSADGDLVEDSAVVVLTDTLPTTLDLITDTVMASGGVAGVLEVTTDTISWEGGLAPASALMISFEAMINSTAVVSEMITNTVLIGGSDISGTLDVISRSAETMVVEMPETLADLSGSTKMVDLSEAEAGEMLAYTIEVSNSAMMTDGVSVVSLMDTLPAGVIYEDGTLTATMGSAMYSSGMISWTGTLSPSTAVMISYMGMIDEAAEPGTMLTNTVEISGTNAGLTEALVRTATTMVMSPTEPSTYYNYLPLANQALPQVEASISRINNIANSWRVSWDEVQGAEYEVQESTDPEFSSFVTIRPGAATSADRQPAASFNNIYYYRVRAVTVDQAGPWSEVLEIRGIYWDDFNDDSSGWDVVRRDYGSTEKRTYYDVADGASILNVRVGGRWDYQVSSSLVELPPGPWRLETRVRLWDQSNLHAYGFVVNGDVANPALCPNEDYNNCFNEYYRLLVTWYGADSTLRTELKRIEFHDGKNAGRGDKIGASRDVPANSPSQTWQDWRIERTVDNRLMIYINNVLIYDVLADRYVDNRYFGFFAATDEYAGLDMQIDYVRVTPLGDE